MHVRIVRKDVFISLQASTSSDNRRHATSFCPLTALPKPIRPMKAQRRSHSNGMSKMRAGSKNEEDTSLHVSDSTGGTQNSPGVPNAGSGFKIMGLQPSAELLAISMVYFVQGTIGLARLAISYLYKDDFHLEPSTVATITALAAAPWMVKPLYGFLSDTLPIFGYRRRSYLIICGLLGTLSWTAMATVVTTPTGAVIATIVGSLSTACSDVVVDSIVVERSRGAPQAVAGSLQSLCWASAAIGGIASAYFSGSFIEAYGVHGVFAITAVFPLIVSLTAFLITEERVPPRSQHPNEGYFDTMGTQLKEQSLALWGAVNQRGILLPAIFVFLWQATPTADTAMFYLQTNKLGFKPEFLGQVRLVGSIASLAGVGAYNTFLKEVSLRKMFLWTALLGAGLGSTQLILITGLNQRLGLSNELFVLGDSMVLTVLGQVSFMPILVLAARLCPEGVEATLFATLMSILNGGGFLGSFLGGVLTGWFGVTAENFDNLAMLVLFCTIFSLAPLLLLHLVPESTPSREQQNE